MSTSPAAGAFVTYSDADLRELIVAEARSWIGTPYLAGTPVKGAGCDCGSFILAVMQHFVMAAGEILENYSLDCWAHWTEEKYLMRMRRHAKQIAETIATRSVAALPGCIVICRTINSRSFNHAGIVTAWPRVLHALYAGVEEIDASVHPLWTHRDIAVFDPLKKPDA